jgi:putative oxidoreductase
MRAIETLRRLNALASRLPWDLAAIPLRVFPATVFFASGQTKVDGWRIADSTWYLFEHEYALPLIPSSWAAVMAVVAEHLFPVLLILGLATRFSALSLLVMTAVIEIFVYPDAWQTHGLWAACFLALIVGGPGRLSVDAAIGAEVPPGRSI